MKTFDRKTYGRIFVAAPGTPEDVEKVIKELDEFEYEYLPKSFITQWAGKIDVTYGHKFEMDIDKLTEACWNRDIWIFCVTGHPDPLNAFA